MRSIYFFLFLIIFSSCTIHREKHYRTEVQIPKKTTSTFTEFEQIRGSEENWEWRDYALFYCVDNRSVRYLLLAPGQPVIEGEATFEKCDFYNSVPLSLEDVNNLLDRLKFAELTWNQKITQEKAYTVDFYITLEQRIDSVSKHVEKIDPNFEFVYQKYESHTSAYMRFKDREKWKLDKLYYIDDLIELLEQGKKRLVKPNPKIKKKS